MNIEDKAAEAIWRADRPDEGGLSWDECLYPKHYRGLAKAAIEALGLVRERQNIPEFRPTGRMIRNLKLEGPDFLPEMELHFVFKARWVSPWEEQL